MLRSLISDLEVQPVYLICSQRWAESERLTLKPVPNTKTPNLAPDPVSLQILDSESGSVPISAMLLHTFYTHHTIRTESGSDFFPKTQIRIRSRIQKM